MAIAGTPELLRESEPGSIFGGQSRVYATRTSGSGYSMHRVFEIITEAIRCSGRNLVCTCRSLVPFERSSPNGRVPESVSTTSTRTPNLSELRLAHQVWTANLSSWPKTPKIRPSEAIHLDKGPEGNFV